MSTATQFIDRVESAEEYHADTSRVGNSMLTDFIEHPMLFHGRYVTGRFPPKPPKAPLVKGTCIHEDVLLPGVFESKVLIIPREVLSKSGSKAGGEWEAFEAEHAGKILLKAQEAEDVKQMLLALQRDQKAWDLLNADGRREHTIHWECRETGLPRKCRIDLLAEITVDLKSAADVSPKAFAKAALERGYNRQHPYYLDGIEAKYGERSPFVFVCVQNCVPYAVACYELDPRFVALGEDKIRPGLRRLGKLWGQPEEAWRRSVASKIVTLSPPNWAFTERDWSLSDVNN